VLDLDLGLGYGIKIKDKGLNVCMLHVLVGIPDSVVLDDAIGWNKW